MKISIITATCNSEKTIIDTIKSINAQDYSNIEHIVIDGCSSDQTVDLIYKYDKRLTTLISEKDAGIYDALNKGISLATGEVIGFLHSDDEYANDQVLSMIAQKFSCKSIDAIYGDLNYVSKLDTTRIIRRWIGGDYNIKKFKNGWMPAHPTFYARRKHYDSKRNFNLNFKISADYDLMLRLLWKKKIKACYIPEVLVKMRVGGKSNRSLKNIFKNQ